MSRKFVKNIEYNTYIKEAESSKEYELPNIKTRKLRDKKKPGKSLRTAWN